MGESVLSRPGFVLGLVLFAQIAAAQEPSPPSAIPSPLQLPQALELFERRGFDLLLADAAVHNAEGDAQIASAFPNPALAAGAGHTWSYDPNRCESAGCSNTPWGGSLTDSGLVADLVIGKRRLRADVAQAALRAARLQRDDAERTLGALLEQEWVQAVVAGALVRTAEQAAAASAQTAQLVELRWKAGDVSEADSARAETAKLQAEQGVDAARQQLAEAKASLAFLLGERSGTPAFDLPAELPDCVPPPELRDATRDDLLARARERRPDVAAAKAQLESAQSGVSLAERARIPDIGLTASYQREGTGNEALTPPTAIFGITVPLPLFYRGQGEVTKAEANLRAQQIASDKVDAQIASDVAQAYAAWQSARSRVERMQSRMLERSRRALDLVDYQYKRGAASLLELLDAQRTWVATQADYEQNVGDWWTSLYQLEAATGETPKS